jgi:ribosome-associated translation inhibitor RaiA
MWEFRTHVPQLPTTVVGPQGGTLTWSSERRPIVTTRPAQQEQAAEQGESPIEIVTRGPVGERQRQRLRSELAKLAEESPRHAVFVRGAITYEQNVSIARPALATATIDLGRRVVRARVAAEGTATAIDLLVARLRRSLRDLRGRDEAARRRIWNEASAH